ncbi:MAG: hypothetical protein ACI9G1_004838, partial [Pirellulaceae bacterium]
MALYFFEVRLMSDFMDVCVAAAKAGGQVLLE